VVSKEETDITTTVVGEDNEVDDSVGKTTTSHNGIEIRR
jgi:hypothetical protein